MYALYFLNIIFSKDIIKSQKKNGVFELKKNISNLDDFEAKWARLKSSQTE